MKNEMKKTTVWAVENDNYTEYYNTEGRAKDLARSRNVKPVEIDIVKPVKVDRFEVTDLDGNIYTHNLADRAWDRYCKTGGHIYAVIDDNPISMTQTNTRKPGDGLLSVYTTHYIIGDVYYVLCVDGHFEPQHHTDESGRWQSGYTDYVIKK